MKKRIFPLFTAAFVLLSLLLPRGVSALRDMGSMRGMHREPYSSALELPDYSLTMAERLQLLGEFKSMESDWDTYVTVFSQELSRREIGELMDLVNAEFRALEELGVLQMPLALDQLAMEYCYVTRFYLQDAETLDTLRLLVWECSGAKHTMNMRFYLDEESGKLLTLRMSGPGTWDYIQGTPEQLGSLLLSRLGVEYKPLGLSPGMADFLLQDEQTVVTVNTNKYFDFNLYSIRQHYEVHGYAELPGP